MVGRWSAIIALGFGITAPAVALGQVHAAGSGALTSARAAFPYFTWPADFTAQNTPVEQAFGHFLFWDGRALQNIEGRTFMVTLVCADDRGTFNEYLIRRTVEAQLAGMGAVRVASGRIPSRVIGTMTDVDKQSLGAGLGDIWNDPVQVWRVRSAGRDMWVQYTDDSARASIAVVEVQTP